MKNIFKSDKKIIRPLLKLAAPIMLGNLFQAAYQLTDAFWVGRLGEKAVAAVAISFPVIFFIISLGIGFSIAGATLTAQYFGAKNEKMVGHSTAQTLLIVVITASVLSVVGYLMTNTILGWLQVDASIIDNAASYLRISFIGMLFNFSFFMFQAIMRSINRAKFPVYIVIGTVLLNFFLDPLFMFGSGLIPALGITGTAIATLITQSIAAIIGITSLFVGKQGIKIHWRDFKPDFPFLLKTARIGLPASLQQSARSLSLAVMTGLISSFGTLAVAAYGVSSNILQLSLMICFGLAGANAALVGQKLGANNKEEATNIAKTSIKLIFVALALIGSLVYIFAPFLIKFFVPNDANVIKEGARLLRFLAPTFSFIGIQIVVGGTLQAAGATTKAMIMTIASQWFIQIPLAFLLAKFFGLGITGIWLTFPLTNFVMAIVYLIVFFRGKWKNKDIINKEEKTKLQVLQETKMDEIVPNE